MTNFIKEDFQFGDIIATRRNTFLSRSIRFFMKLLYPKDKTTFSHIAVVINIYGEKYIAEALGWGVRIWSIEESGYLKNEEIIICRHKVGFNSDKIIALSKKCVSLGGVRYQYENLPQWIVKILFKWNWFKKSNEKAIYCSELGAIAINAAYPGTFAFPNSTSPADHYNNTNLYFLMDRNFLLD